jgi:hypothetical protein
MVLFLEMIVGPRKGNPIRSSLDPYFVDRSNQLVAVMEVDSDLSRIVGPILEIQIKSDLFPRPDRIRGHI